MLRVVFEVAAVVPPCHRRHVVPLGDRCGATGSRPRRGGKYLLVPPVYTGELPASGYNVAKLRTTHAILLGRMFLENDDPQRPVELLKKTLRIYPYQPGGFGTSIATALKGKAQLLRSPDGKLDWAFLRPQSPATFCRG